MGLLDLLFWCLGTGMRQRPETLGQLGHIGPALQDEAASPGGIPHGMTLLESRTPDSRPKQDRWDDGDTVLAPIRLRTRRDNRRIQESVAKLVAKPVKMTEIA